MSHEDTEPKSLLPYASNVTEIRSDSHPKPDAFDDSYLGSRKPLGTQHRKGNLKDCVFLILGLCLITSFVYPQWPLPTNIIAEVLQPTPLTIDQRVTKILTSTPLIGKALIRSYNDCEVLTNLFQDCIVKRCIEQ